MAWDFETDPEFQKELDWIDAFVREEVEPLDHVLGNPYDIHNPRNQKLVRPLQAAVRKKKLWACHLGPELGGRHQRDSLSRDGRQRRPIHKLGGHSRRADC